MDEQEREIKILAGGVAYESSRRGQLSEFCVNRNSSQVKIILNGA